MSATRYVAPLREGGSLPALVEADDDGLYVRQIPRRRQGREALVAELVGRRAGAGLGLPVPEIVFVRLDPALGRAEPDPEIQDLLDASAGSTWPRLPARRAGLRPAAGPAPDPALAAESSGSTRW